MQEGLVVAGLEFVGTDEKAVGVLLDLLGDVAAGESVEGRLRDLRPAELVFTGKRDNRLVGTPCTASSAMSAALADPEDTVNDALEKRMQARKMLTNASYFAFTATPKNKTLELFGKPRPPDAEGKIKHDPFHGYTMKQAIQEGFILDVLKSYTPVDSYYKLVKKIEGDPEFDTKKAQKKLRKYVESHDHAIRLKGEIMVDHFHEQVMAFNKIGGQARAMLVCNGIERAIQYFHAFQDYLKERKSRP